MQESEYTKGDNPLKCKRCLIYEMAENSNIAKTITEYIAGLDIDIKSEETIYHNRLNICKECDMLLSGMCRSCGCYVEMRAALQKNTCPRKKW